NREYIKNTLRHFDMQTTVAEEDSSKGTICFTGKSTYKRSDMEARATEKGYTPVGSVSSSLTILVTADPDSKSSKITKALKLGVKIISEDEFWKL
ncbi:MAG: BRCT domain-containing protein, partial [Desulfitobacteriaceae bacterium]|nr:BRCT domain-containing protein [Desulfitobacteriaceae bacterium]